MTRRAFSRALRCHDAPRRSRMLPRTSGNCFKSWAKNQLFVKISILLVSQTNLCFDQTFSKTHRQTQRIHSWIALGLRKVQKLVPCQTNTQTCMRAVNRQPMFTARRTRRAFSLLCACILSTNLKMASNFFRILCPLINEIIEDHWKYRKKKNLEIFDTCMRAVNRQPCFRAGCL